MPGSIRSMHLEHMLRDVQTDRGSLLHGRLLGWQFDTVTLARRCRRGRPPHHPLLTFLWLISTPPDRVFSPPYEISYGGVKLPRVSADLGCWEVRRRAD